MKCLKCGTIKCPHCKAMRTDGDTCPTCGIKDDRAEDRLVYEHPGDRPYGLMPDPNNPRKSVKEYNEVAIVETICWRWKQNDSLCAIQKWLVFENMLNRSGKPFHHWQVKRILSRAGLL